MSDVIINVENLTKTFKLYNHPKDRLKEALSPFRKTYHSVYHALKDISFEIRKGESVGILGKNGAGKSTLLKMLTGVVTPTSGKVTVNGKIAALLELGAGFNPELSGMENIYFQGAILGFSRGEMTEKVNDIVRFADIGEFIDQPVKTYSSGMFARLAFSIAINVEPDILIVDEALAVGDALFQKRCYQKIQMLSAKGVAIILVSHDQETVRTLTQKALVLSGGKGVFFGKSAEAVLVYRDLLEDEQSRLDNNINNEKVPSPKIFNEIGTKEVRILNTTVLNKNGEENSVFHSGELIKIKIECESNVDITNINVSTRIRSKEGFKIFSWGTLNQDMKVISGLDSGDVFWEREFRKGDRFEVCLEFKCNLGANYYEVQTGITHEKEPDYSDQRVLHWMDESAFFSVNVLKNENFFGGIVDLGMKAEWSKVMQEN